MIEYFDPLEATSVMLAAISRRAIQDSWLAVMDFHTQQEIIMPDARIDLLIDGLVVALGCDFEQMIFAFSPGLYANFIQAGIIPSAKVSTTRVPRLGEEKEACFVFTKEAIGMNGGKINASIAGFDFLLPSLSIEDQSKIIRVVWDGRLA